MEYVLNGIILIFQGHLNIIIFNGLLSHTA